MKYLLLLCLFILTIAASAPVFAQVTVPSPHCLGSCKTQTSATNNGTNTVSLGPSTTTSGTPSNSPTNPSAAPAISQSPTSTTPCSTSQASVTSQSTGQVSAFHDHDNDDKWHHHGKRGYLQNFIQLLLQLLQQLFQKLGINITLPNTSPCGTNSSPSTAPSNAPSSGAGGGGGTVSGTPSGNPSPTVFGTSPAPSTQPSGTTGTTSSGFIGVSGSQLTLNGKVYKSIGFNFSPVGSCWNSNWTTAQMDQFFQSVPPNSIARFFAPPGGTDSVSLVQSIVKEADKYKVHLLISLAVAGVYGQCDAADSDSTSNGKTAAYYTDAVKAGSPYANWVKSVVTPLANDPGVAIWEIVNEPWHGGATIDQAGGVAGATAYTNAAAAMIRAAETAGAGKPKQLITLGPADIGETGGVSGMESIFKNLDIVDDHDYSGDLGGATQYESSEFPQLQQVAQALGKPYMVDETGVEAGTSCSSSNIQGAWDNGSAGLSLASRVNFLVTQKATDYFKGGASAVGFWLYTGNGGGCTYENIYPGDPIIAAVKSYQIP